MCKLWASVNTVLPAVTSKGEHKVNTPGKAHKSLRLERDLADRVAALGVDGESEADTYRRVLVAGVEAIEGGPVGTGGPETPSDASALISSLQAHIDTLKAANEALSAQMAVKDKQLDTLSVLTAQAQQATAKALEAPADDEAQGKRRGFWSRLFG